jgi:hypothetical protein
MLDLGVLSVLGVLSPHQFFQQWWQLVLLDHAEAD